MPEPPNASALSDIKVLDLSRVIAGPLATQILGDLGADVVKVERPDSGDDIRRNGPPWTGSGAAGDPTSTYFMAVNRNKRSITIDYSNDEGARVIRELACRADVFVENFRPGTLARYGLGPAQLRAANPRLIYCSVTGFGQTGPYSERSGYDYLAQAMSGVMTVNGPADGGPTRVGIPVADICAGHYAAMGVMAALHHRAATGVGQEVDISLFEAQLAALLNAFSGPFNGGQPLGRTGNDHPSAAPYGIFDVADGQILIAIFNDREFARLALALDRSEWVDDRRFATNSSRVRHALELREAMHEALKHESRTFWMDRLNAAKISCGPLNEIRDLAEDPHATARQSIVALDQPDLGVVWSVANPIRLAAAPPSYRLAPPSLGAHTTQVLFDWLGIDEAQVEALRRVGALG